MSNCHSVLFFSTSSNSQKRPDAAQQFAQLENTVYIKITLHKFALFAVVTCLKLFKGEVKAIKY